ncbi:MULTISPECIES: MarR family winged helix-turn-helix transcriptional regulator [Catenuloplanes]|uniref:DNA-binding MarR family transcriptional regulator n=1 Tax=Catenuloplanes niger TaxID=587534 RepID=A0AAE4CWF9_9ACTN|nr:MarR family transcriptional regulator [Catenuloplanes niger]MDR7327190.1 DNA-binding MarR family transcriptional regulator [Catenuloplanes niger]
MPRKLPDRDELHIWREFIEATEALRTRVTGRLHDDTGLGAGDYTVLLTLSEAPDTRLRSSELATRVGWERSRLSHHLGRMERRGLITRTGAPGDNRGALIVMTPDGGAAFHAATIPHLRVVRELFVDALTPEQLTAAGEIAAALRDRLRDR